MQKRLRLNHFIRDPEVRVIDENNNQLGVIKTTEALRLAQEHDLDLVEVAPNAKPPVCRILDYGAYQYQQEKSERKSKAKQKKSEIKGIRLSFKMGQHDIEVRSKQSRKFVDQGHKVRLEILLKGRERAHRNLAVEKLKTFVINMGDDIITDQELSHQGGKIFLIIRKK
ncbi:MAG: translation initiation factor IF-3 [bacterium]